MILIHPKYSSATTYENKSTLSSQNAARKSHTIFNQQPHKQGVIKCEPHLCNTKII